MPKVFPNGADAIMPSQQRNPRIRIPQPANNLFSDGIVNESHANSLSATSTRGGHLSAAHPVEASMLWTSINCSLTRQHEQIPINEDRVEEVSK
jgi:hypothetical protein